MEDRDPTMLAAYELALRGALSHQMPIGEGDRHILIQLQQTLKLPNSQVRTIHQRVTAEIKQQEVRYQDQVGQYEQQFVDLLEPDGTVTPANRTQLKQLQCQLGLKDTDIQVIEEQAQHMIGQHHGVEPALPVGDRLPPDTLDLPTGADRPQPRPTEVSEETASTQPTTDPTLDAESLEPDTESDRLSDLPIFVDTSNLQYNRLKTHLVKSEWMQADAETLAIMLTATVESVSWMSPDAIHKLPCEALEQLDHLWQDYSNGRFGFGVQHSIFQNMETGDNQVIRFGKKVGWTLLGREFVGFKYYNQLTFGPSSADIPVGHFPARWFWQIPWFESLRSGGLGTGRGGCGEDAANMFVTMMGRFDLCDHDDTDI
ncbi:MAG: GUN4 domain-containing protein [Leptolyngbyaceae cyanobacterium]